MNMHKNYSYIYASSKDCIPAFSKVFNYDEKYIKSVPLPRIDLLKDKKYQSMILNKILNRYPILKKKINLVYAPTYRKDDTDTLKYINDLFKKILTMMCCICIYIRRYCNLIRCIC